MLTNDSYTLRLTATDAGGNTAMVERTVNVSGNLKLGNFTLSFVDLSIPVSGIPIQVTRTYDTMQASQDGDLGFGWRLDVPEVRLRTSVPKTGLETDGIFNGFRDGTKVYVTPPGGRREGFTFRPQAQRFLLVTFYHPVFVPDPGVTSRLTVSDFMLRPRSDEYVGALSGLPYNPADPIFGGVYALTTKEGTRYQINGQTGMLETAADRNGNTLSFSDGGIVSSTGTAVTFARDPQGRIVAVIDPMGHEVRYEYDAAGDLIAVTDRENNRTQFVYRTDRPHYLDRVIDPSGGPAPGPSMTTRVALSESSTLRGTGLS
jgi:YD repeat-containing protein